MWSSGYVQIGPRGHRSWSLPLPTGNKLVFLKFHFLSLEDDKNVRPFHMKYTEMFCDGSSADCYLGREGWTWTCLKVYRVMLVIWAMGAEGVLLLPEPSPHAHLLPGTWARRDWSGPSPSSLLPSSPSLPPSLLPSFLPSF